MVLGWPAGGGRQGRYGPSPAPSALLTGARAAVFAALVLVLSAGSHTLMSQAPLPAPTLAAAGAGAFALVLLLGRRERSFGQIAALVVPLELALDTLFTTGQATCYATTGGGPITGPWHSVSSLLMCGGASPSAAGAPQVPVAGALAPWLVLAAHLLLGLAAAWWLRAGEAAAFRLLRAVAALAAAPLRAALALLSALAATGVRAPSPPPGAPRRTAVPATPLLLHSVVRRGPPYRLRTACR
ncbi:hypothetical protein [Peterkaempfera bronchialis]|uniref:hypothetical protein n=1 Tax=Peterkaempfera bronchialis TaxID=2126346 RepID=UPI001E64D03F|nr:hypothetical protein [Peterkaempfera bronchialis]